MNEDETLQAILSTPYKLFPSQRKAVISSSRYLRIIAGAGAGKTETLTRRIAYLLLCKEQAPSSIVAFTFTDRASQSMKNRIYQRVAQFRGHNACANLGEMYIGTIHGFCMRLLQDYFGYGNYEVLDENQEMAFLMREGWGLGFGKSTGRYSDKCSSFLRSVNLVYDELLDLKTLAKESPEFFHQFQKYENALKQHRLLTYAQMITFAVNHLKNNESVLSIVKHLIVDEYQDINRAQGKLIEIIGENTSIFVVGDPRQCIYRWRGSDETYFEKFTTDFKGAEKVSIAENSRSCPEIVAAANCFANSFKSAKYESLKPIRSEQGFIAIRKCDTDVSEAKWVTNQIEKLVKKKACDYSDISILLRSVSTSAKPFIDECKNRGIPHLIGGKVGLFRRDEAQVMGCLYAWLDNDGFWVKDQYNWRDRIQGEDLLQNAIQVWKSLLNLKQFPLNEVLKWKQSCLLGKYQHFTETYQSLLHILDFDNFDPKNKTTVAIMANLGRFNALLTDYESSIRRGGNSINWQKVWRGLVWYMNTYASGAYEEQPAEDLRGVDAIQIMTVHQAKGLEWPVVFIPCMTSLRFPSSKSGQSQGWLIPETLFDSERYFGGLEDERKLFYVAMTRSKEICHISYFDRLNRSMTKSEFLGCLGKEISEKTEDVPVPDITINKSDDKEEIQTFSGGEIIGYRRCPYFYRLRELWNYQAGLDPALGYGKSLHHCLRVASEKIKGGTSLEDSINQAVEEEFHLPYAHPKAKETMMEAARRKLKLFVKQHEDDMNNIEEVEARLEFPVEKATITGRVDVILKSKEKPVYEVRDYKTSEEVTTFDESSLQVRLYTLGLRNMGRPVEKASIAYLETGQIKTVDISGRHLDDAKKLAEESIRGITSAVYEAKPQSKCNCDYERICCYCKKT